MATWCRAIRPGERAILWTAEPRFGLRACPPQCEKASHAGPVVPRCLCLSGCALEVRYHSFQVSHSMYFITLLTRYMHAMQHDTVQQRQDAKKRAHVRGANQAHNALHCACPHVGTCN